MAIQKIDSVASVDVSLQRATTEVQLRAGNRVTLAQLRQIIKNNGFATKEASVTVLGTLIERGGQPAVAVTGSETVLIMAPDPKAPAAFKQAHEAVRAKKTALIEVAGVVQARADGPDRIVVATYAPAK